VLPPLPQLIAFVAVAAVLTITPGADMALIMRQVLASGRRAAFTTSLGIGVGCLIHATASALGLAYILARSAVAFDVLKYAGGAYLIYLGMTALRDAAWGMREPESTPRMRHGSDFSIGLLTNLLNPKVAVFYLTFLPQFVSPTRSIVAQSLFLATIHVAMGIAWLTLYARFIDSMAAAFASSRVRRRLEALTGVVLIGMGVRLAAAKR